MAAVIAVQHAVHLVSLSAVVVELTLVEDAPQVVPDGERGRDQARVKQFWAAMLVVGHAVAGLVGEGLRREGVVATRRLVGIGIGGTGSEGGQFGLLLLTRRN